MLEPNGTNYEANGEQIVWGMPAEQAVVSTQPSWQPVTPTTQPTQFDAVSVAATSTATPQHRSGFYRLERREGYLFVTMHKSLYNPANPPLRIVNGDLIMSI